MLLASIISDNGAEISAVAAAVISAATGLVGHRIGKRKRNADVDSALVETATRVSLHMEERVNWVSKQIEKAEEKIDRLTKTVEGLENSNRSLRERLSDLTLEVTQLRGERDAATTSRDKATKERDKLEAKVKKLETKVEKLQREIDKLEAGAGITPTSPGDGSTQTITVKTEQAQP